MLRVFVRERKRRRGSKEQYILRGLEGNYTSSKFNVALANFTEILSGAAAYATTSRSSLLSVLSAQMR
jgi:hypothetical protein